MLRAGSILIVAACITGCASAPGNRAQWVPPTELQGVTAAYSDVNLKARLLIAQERASCAESSCSQGQGQTKDKDLERRVADLGAQLSRAAYVQFPGLEKRIPEFKFSVVDKQDARMASSASGEIVFYRGLDDLALTNSELAFLLSREMGHVVLQHHDENVLSSFAVSIIANLLFPVLNVASGAAALLSTTTVQNTAVASAASLAGSEALKASFRPIQLHEADVFALELLHQAGWDCRQIADGLEVLASTSPLDKSEWESELKTSSAHVARLLQGPQRDVEMIAENDWLARQEDIRLSRTSLVPDQERGTSSPF